MLTKLCAGNISSEIQLTSELQSTYITTNVIIGVCSFVAVVGNVLIILAILRNSSLRHNPSFMLIFNLAVSDVGVGLIVQPLSIALTVMGAKNDFELSCSKFSIAFKYTAGCLIVLSFLTNTAVSFDRFLAIHLKLNYRSVVTVKRMKVVILLLWLIAILWGMEFALDYTILRVISTVIGCVCLTLTIFNYAAIVSKLYRYSEQLNKRNREVDSSNQHKSFNIGQYKKSLKSMLYVYGAFLLCYLPFLFCTIPLQSTGPTSTIEITCFITGTLVLANRAINPCLYYWRIAELRQAVRKLLGLGRLVRSEATRATRATSDSFKADNI